MKCPVCNDVRMREVEKDGVLIDVCPDCKGVWLDRGELEKLLSEIREIRPAFNEWYDGHNQSFNHTPNHNPNHSHNPNFTGSQHGGTQYNSFDPRYSGSSGKHYGHYKKHKKKSVLDVFGDLFD